MSSSRSILSNLVGPDDSASNLAAPSRASTASSASTNSPIYDPSGIRTSLALIPSLETPLGCYDFLTTFTATLTSRGVPAQAATRVIAKVWRQDDRHDPEDPERMEEADYNPQINQVIVRSRTASYLWHYLDRCHPLGPPRQGPDLPATPALRVALLALPPNTIARLRSAVHLPLEFVLLAEHALMRRPTQNDYRQMRNTVDAILQHFYDNNQNVYNSLINYAGPDPQPYAVDIGNGNQHHGNVHYPAVLIVFVDYIIAVRPPTVRAVERVHGRNQCWAGGFVNYVNRLRRLYLDGSVSLVETDGEPALEVEDTDADNLGQYDHSIKGELCESFAKIQNVQNITRMRLYWDLRTRVDAHDRERRIKQIDVGGLMPFTIEGLQRFEHVFTVSAGNQNLDTPEDLVTLAGAYSFLNGDLNSLAWRTNHSCANARFFIGDTEYVASDNLGFVSPPTGTADTTLSWLRPWLWYEQLQQVGGIRRYLGPGNAVNALAHANVAFPLIRAFPANWKEIPQMRTEMWESLYHGGKEHSLVFELPVCTWNHVYIMSLLVSEWPTHLVTVNARSFQPFASCPRVPDADTASSAIIIISNRIYGLAGPNPGHSVLIGANVLYNHLRVLDVRPNEVASSICEVANSIMYTSACQRGRLLAALLANPRYIERPDGEVHYALPSTLTYDDIELPLVRWRSPLAHFFSAEYVTGQSKMHQPLTQLSRANCDVHNNAALGLALSTQAAAQQLHFMYELNLWGRYAEFVVSGRPGLQPCPAAVTTYANLYHENVAYSATDNAVCDYTLALLKVQNHISAYNLPLAFMARLHLWSNPERESGHQLSALIRTGVVDVSYIFKFIDFDEIISVAANVPHLWPMIFVSDTLNNRLVQRYDGTGNQAVYRWSTYLLTRVHIGSQNTRNEDVMPVIRLICSALEVTDLEAVHFKEDSVATGTPDGQSVMHVRYLLTARGRETDVPDIDYRRTWDWQSDRYTEFNYREDGTPTSSQYLREKGITYGEAFDGLPSVGPVRVSERRDTTSAYVPQKRRGAVTVETDTSLLHAKRSTDLLQYMKSVADNASTIGEANKFAETITISRARLDELIKLAARPTTEVAEIQRQNEIIKESDRIASTMPPAAIVEQSQLAPVSLPATLIGVRPAVDNTGADALPKSALDQEAGKEAADKKRKRKKDKLEEAEKPDF